MLNFMAIVYNDLDQSVQPPSVNVFFSDSTCECVDVGLFIQV